MKISYCTTCKGRLEHLKATLSHNLKSQQGNVEFVILNYDSPDGMDDYILSTYASEIASGLIRYIYFRPAPHFRMSHAKNIAHSMATGDIVCNVDADNFLPEGFTREIERRMERGTDVVSFRAVTIPGFLWARYGRKLLGMRRAPSGLFGRIAVRKSLFDAIGGYNENLKGWGGDDIDFLLRARNSGAKLDLLPARLWGTTIGHEDEERLANYSDEDRAVSAALMRKERLRDMVDRIRRLLTHKDVTADTEPFSRRFTLTEVECNIFHLAPV